MKLSRPASSFYALCAVAALVLAALAGCAETTNRNQNGGAAANVAASPLASPTAATQTLNVVDTPQRIKEMISGRGQQDEAAPVLRFVEPREGQTINSSTVPVRLNLSGDLKGYKPMKDPATGMGNHIHVILDNQPYEAYYNLDQSFELRNVTEGTHTLRVFPSRPWHESYKNEGAFQMVTFTVRGGGGDASKPTTTATGQTMADNRNSPAAANANTAAAAPAREGKEMSASQAGAVTRTAPLLTYSRPKGEYKGNEADPIMIDFWLTNTKLQADGGEHRVRYTIDGGEPKFIDKWAPIWLSGWTAGKHTIKLELVDRSGNAIDNGGYNTTSREITVAK